MNTNKTVKQAKKASVKYNGCQLDKGLKYALFMDWLTLNLEGKPSFQSDRINEDVQDYGTPQFKDRALIEFDGVKFGTLTYNNRMGKINQHLVQLKLENHLFYTLPLPKIYEMLTDFLRLSTLKFTGVNRLDLALDFNESQHDVKNLMLDMFNGCVLMGGRSKDLNIYTETKKGRINLNGFQLGSRSSARFLRCYDKTKEQVKSVKTYIFDAWEQLGLKSTEDDHVWRFEYQLTNTFFSDLENVSLENLFSAKALFNLLKFASANHFELKQNTGKKETNKEESYTFISWSRVAKSIGVNETPLKKIRRIIKETLIGQQRMIKGLLRSYFSTNQSAEFLFPMKRILMDFSLREWFDRKLPFYLDEFRKQQIIVTYDRKKFNDDLMLDF